MKKKTIYSLLVALLIPLFSCLAAKVENFESLKVVTSKMPEYPIKLVSEGVFEGFAQVVVRVNEEGVLTDVYSSTYTHPEFGRLSEKYIKMWTFQPAKLNGEPMSVIKPFDFKFEDKRGVYSVLPMEAAVLRMNFGSHFSEDGKRIYGPEELDDSLTPLKMEGPLYPEEFKGQNIDGTATIIFYIDEEGEIRMPHVTENSQYSFGVSALNTVKKWKYKPPLVDGNPVSVMVRQEFIFNGKKSTAPGLDS